MATLTKLNREKYCKYIAVADSDENSEYVFINEMVSSLNII